MRNEILIGDCRETLKTIPSGTVHCCVTSPPYFGLRDYGHESQIGLEGTPEAFVAELVNVFAEVHRVMRDDGTLWVNIGDSYCAPNGRSSGKSYSMGPNSQLKHREGCQEVGIKRSFGGSKPKDLIGIPWLMAFALRSFGWYLRQEIIWHKPAPMPESVQDRCTKAHEHIFLFAKSNRYFYDAEAIKEESVGGSPGNKNHKSKTAYESGDESHRTKGGLTEMTAMSSRNKRSVWKVDDPYELHRWLEQNHPELIDQFFDSGKSNVWSVSHQGFKGAHFAVFPPKLIEPCILAGSPEKCCSECGSPYIRQIEKERIPTRPGTDSKVNRASDDPESPYEQHSGMVVGNRDPRRHVTSTKTIGFEPSCECNAGSSPGIVLDPFAGSGTTAQVAQDNGRDWIMCEANSEYVDMIKKRTSQPVLF